MNHFEVCYSTGMLMSTDAKYSESFSFYLGKVHMVKQENRKTFKIINKKYFMYMSSPVMFFK